MKPDHLKAVVELVGGEVCGTSDGSKINYLSGQTPPTESQINAKLKELEADYDAKKYQRDRELVYPNIQDIVVALAEKEEGDDTMWKEITAQRAKVKADNPKPE